MPCLCSTKGFITKQPQLADPSQEMSIWTSLAETTPYRKAMFQFKQQKTITSRINPQNFWKGKKYYPLANYLEECQWSVCLNPVRYELEKWRCLLTVSKFISPELNTWFQIPIIGMLWYWKNFLLCTEEDYQMWLRCVFQLLCRNTGGQFAS